MYLTPKESERLTLFTAAEIARQRKDRGILLNVPEAIASGSDYIVEGAREDRSVAQLMSYHIDFVLYLYRKIPEIAKSLTNDPCEGNFCNSFDAFVKPMFLFSSLRDNRDSF